MVYVSASGRVYKRKPGPKKQHGGAKKKTHHKKKIIHGGSSLEQLKYQNRHDIIRRQTGGFVLPVAAGIAALKALKPAKGLQNLIKSSGFDKNPFGGAVSSILEVPKQFGFGTATVIEHRAHHARRKHKL